MNRSDLTHTFESGWHNCRHWLVLAWMILSCSQGSVQAQLNVVTKRQFLEFGLVGGTMMYQGDLSHNYYFYVNYKPTFGGFIAYPLNEHFSAKLMYLQGYIAGADSNALEVPIQTRNLDFFSDIHEWSIQLDMYLLRFNSLKEGSSSFSPYFSTGLTVYHFNPMSTFTDPATGLDTVYALQPLGTEGQGTSAFPDRKPYMLTQVAIPLEFGFKFTPVRYLAIGLTGGVKLTFTDYLDDVSTTYVNPEILINENGMVSYLLSNRTWEVTENGEPLALGNKATRGGADSNDYYGYLAVTLSYLFIPEYKFNVSRKAGIHCTKF